MLKRLSLLTACLAMAPVVAACGSSATAGTSHGGTNGKAVDPAAGPFTPAKASKVTQTAKKGVKIGLVLWAPVESEQTVEKEILSAAKAAGWSVEVTQANGSASAARNAMQTYVQSGVAGIINLATDNTSLTSVIAQAHAQKVPFVSMFVAPTPGVVNISPSTYADISTITNYLIKRTGGKGDVAIINTSAIPILRERETLFRAFLKQRAPQMRIVGRHELSFTPSAIEDAKTAAAAFLAKDPNLKAIWTSFDDPGAGAALAIKAAGKASSVFSTGIDGDSSFVNQMGPGSPAAATVRFNFRGIAQETIWALNALMAGERIPRAIWFSNPLLTASNLSQRASLVGGGLIPCAQLKDPSELAPCKQLVGVQG